MDGSDDITSGFPLCILSYLPPTTPGLCQPAHNACHKQWLSLLTFMWMDW